MIHKKNLFPYRSFLFLLICLLLPSCKKATSDGSTITPEEITLPATASPLPTGTRALTPSPTYTFTPLPTLTLTPTPQFEVNDDELGFAGMHLPPDLAFLEKDNLHLLRKLSLWGYGRVNDIVLSSSGTQMAVATNLGVSIYNSTSFVQVNTLNTAQPAQTLAFSGDDQWIALAIAPDEVWIYPISQDKPVAWLNLAHWDLPQDHHIKLFFTPDDSQLIHIVQSPTTLLIDRWDTTTWQHAESFSIGASPAAYIHPTLNIAGILTDDQLFLQSLVQTGEFQTVPVAAAEPDSFWGQIQSIIPGAHGDFLILNTEHAIARWQLLEEEFSYHIEGFQYQEPIPCQDVPTSCLNQNREIGWTCDLDEEEKNPVETIGLSPNEQILIISKRSGWTECRLASDGAFLWEIDARYSKLSFSPDSAFFYGLLPDGTIEKRTSLDGLLIASLKEHPNQLFDMAISPDGSILAAGYNDGWIRVFNASNGALEGILDGVATSLAFSSTGQQLAAGLIDGTIRIFELNLGRYYDLANGRLAAVTDLAFFQDDQRLLTGSDDCTAGIWNIPQRYRTLRITPDEANPFQISNVAIDPEQMTRFFSGIHKNGMIIQSETPDETEPLIPQSVINDLAISPDHSLLGATGPNTWLLSLQPSLQTRTSKLLSSDRLTNGLALGFSMDSNLMAVATEQDVIFWSLPDGEEITSLRFLNAPRPHSSPVDLEFYPDGTLLAVAGEDGLIHIFGIPAIAPETN